MACGKDENKQKEAVIGPVFKKKLKFFALAACMWLGKNSNNYYVVSMKIKKYMGERELVSGFNVEYGEV